jgi:hypothetical protein
MSHESVHQHPEGSSASGIAPVLAPIATVLSQVASVFTSISEILQAIAVSALVP